MTFYENGDRPTESFAPGNIAGLLLAIIRVVAVLFAVAGVWVAYLLLDAHGWHATWVAGALGYLMLIVGVPRILYVLLRRRFHWSEVHAALLAYTTSLLFEIPFFPVFILSSIF